MELEFALGAYWHSSILVLTTSMQPRMPSQQHARGLRPISLPSVTRTHVVRGYPRRPRLSGGRVIRCKLASSSNRYTAMRYHKRHSLGARRVYDETQSPLPLESELVRLTESERTGIGTSFRVPSMTICTEDCLPSYL
jgi:hypothetical protein